MEIFQDERIKKVIKKLQDAIKLTHFEGKVYLVGGVVRDSILGINPIKDIDVVVEYKNGGVVVAQLLAAREKCYVQGKNPVIFPTYGTAKLNLFKDEDLKDLDIEFVQTRKEQYHKESRNPDTAYGTIEEDAKRRDLTINALYYNISDGKIYDYSTSLYDLSNKIIRTPCDADIVFNDDSLRILRTIRFSCRFGWGIEKNTWLGMVKNAHRIKVVSQERISDELSKILVGENASVGIRKLYYCGVLKHILPDVYDMHSAYESRNPIVTTFDHTMNVLDAVSNNIESRLAALFHDVGKVITDHDRSISPDMFSADITSGILKGMKFPNDVITAVTTAIRYHRVFDIYADGVLPPDKKIRKVLNLCGADIGTTLDLMNANNLYRTYSKKKKQVLDIINRIEELEEVEKMTNVKLPINGKDIMKKLGIKGGPVIGILLESVKDAYFENPNITKEECYEIVEKKLKEIV